MSKRSKNIVVLAAIVCWLHKTQFTGFLNLNTLHPDKGRTNIISSLNGNEIFSMLIGFRIYVIKMAVVSVI